MAKITRAVQKIFGSTATAGEIGVFGSLAAGSAATTTDPTVIQSLSNYLGGWFSAVVGGNSPAIEDMNALFYLYAYQLAYLFQAGVAEWQTDTVYYIGSLVNSGGKIYVSRTDTNTGNAVTNATYWRSLEADVVSKTFADTGFAAEAGQIILWDASGGDSTCALPSAAANRGGTVTLVKKKTDTSENTVSFTSVDGITGIVNPTLTEPGQSTKVASDGTGWYSV